MNNQKPIKICAVCGDIAFARNFGAFSCKSCKPFFRRNALKNSFKCKSGGICQINQMSRKKCRKCRLDKCFAVGMKKELIRSFKEEETAETSEHIYSIESELDIISQSLSFMNSCDEPSSSKEEITLDKNRLKSDTVTEHCLELLPFCDPNVNSTLNDELISEFEFCLTITEAIRKSSELYESLFDLLSKSVAISRPLINYDKNFTEIEEYKLNELFHVFKPIFNSLNKGMQIIRINNIEEMVEPNIIFYERGIKRLIEATKKMNVFKNICENDRIALVKYSSMETICLRSIQDFDISNESWIIEKDQERSFMMRLTLLKSLKSDVYMIYKNYFNYIISECDSDSVILDLLTAIAFFNPNRPNLIDKQIVKVEQQFYLYLLKRYLTFKYRSKSQLEVKSMRILSILSSAYILSEMEIKYFIGNYQEQYSPLVKEVFDLQISKCNT